MIAKPEEHEINRAGNRLLREALEPLGWVVNDVQEDYGIDCNVQVFDGKSPTGAWFHIQLKSSASSGYSADRAFVSQELSVDHARHYSMEIREPVLVIHADVTSRIVYWYAPQLDRQLAKALGKTGAKSVTMRIPTSQHLPATAPELLTILDRIYLALANRELTSASTRSFAESLKHMPDQAALHQAFQRKNDMLKVRRIHELYQQRKLDEARPRARLILDDPDSTIEVKFWAEIELEAIDHTETVHSGKPQSELAKVGLAHAKALRRLTTSGPAHLKFFALISEKAAELYALVYENLGLFMALKQHTDLDGDPMMILGIYARRSANTKLLVAKYNQCLRLARYAADSPHRWALARALPRIVNAIGFYTTVLRGEENLGLQEGIAQSALQICKLVAWIASETGDLEAVVLAIISALMTVRSEDSDAYRWAEQAARSLPDVELREDAVQCIERAVKRWHGERVEGDYRGDTKLQIVQNMAAALGVDPSNENDPLVRGLTIAARDSSPERVLATCEHLVVSLGAMGPIARRIEIIFNLGTAGSKVAHCTLHGYHKEGRELDTAYRDFKQLHCDSCPDKKPRPEGWRYTDDVRREIDARNYEFVARLAGTEDGLRYTDKD